MKLSIFLLPVIFLTLSACATQSQDIVMASKTGQACTEPRPEVCTRDYRPVCANLKDGTEKTYSNGCTACTDANADSWIEGECSQ